MIIIQEEIYLWNNWEIRGMVLFSLILQIILHIFGSRRKYISRIWIRMLVWSAYSLADVVASVALSVLARNLQGFPVNNLEHNLLNSFLIQAFWAPFLLLHLGGPDTITAYYMEDNELWIRQLLNLLIQVEVAIYVLVRSSGTTLTYLAIPVFITGIIKYGERIWALKSSPAKNIRDSVLSVHPVIITREEEIIVVSRECYLEKINYLHEANYLFKMSKCLFEDIALSFKELRDSYSIISGKSPKDAFTLAEVELGFMYDRLHTKLPIVYSYKGIFLHCVSFLSSITALVVFPIIINNHDHAIAGIDIAITYLLLVGATVLEVYAFLYIIFSDKAMIWLTKFKNPAKNSISDAICSLHTCLANGTRWSRSMAQGNLIDSCLQETMLSKCAELFGMDEIMMSMRINWEEVNDELKDLLFKQLLEKGEQVIKDPNDAKLHGTLLAQRGDDVLKKRGLVFHWSTAEGEFKLRILIWHIATDLCYYVDLHVNNNLHSRWKICKCLSDYMFYLLTMRPYMLPKELGNIRRRYQDTCIEVKDHFRRYSEKVKACLDLIEQDPTEEAYGADINSKSVLSHGRKLARLLQSRLGIDEKWEMISEVWIEMLSYAASHCEWKVHAQQLRRGGELLTHVCLLMAHLGLSQQYEAISQHKFRSEDDPLGLEILEGCMACEF